MLIQTIEKEIIPCSKDNYPKISETWEGFAEKKLNRKLAKETALKPTLYLTALVAVETALHSFDGSVESYTNIIQLLRKSCTASRICVFENYISQDGSLQTLEKAQWKKEESKLQEDEICYQNVFSYCYERLARGDIICGTVAELSEPESQDLAASESLSLVLPIISKSKFWGFLCIEKSIEAGVWEPAEVLFLQASVGAFALAQECLWVKKSLTEITRENKSLACDLENQLFERTVQLKKEIAYRERIQKELEKFLSLQQVTLECTTDGIVIVDNQSKITGYNQKFMQMWQIPESVIASQNHRNGLKIGLNQLKNKREYIASVKQLQSQPELQIYDLVAFKDGRVFKRYRRPQRIGSHIVGRIWCFRDVSDRFVFEAKIQHQALHDHLTDLPNRKQFNQRLSASLTQAAAEDSQLAVCFLDLDRFKTINNSLGHGIGDKLLQSVAERLSAFLGENNTIARWGGDEFTLLLPQITDPLDASRIAKAILATLKPAFDIENHHLHISASIGIALYPIHGKDEETLIKNADVALYCAKSGGRNSYQIYNSALNSQASELLILENSLHHAIEREELRLYYQPQVNISTGEITKMEALLRWEHPKWGLISPNKLIPLAEETGLIVPIGEWVLHTACTQNKWWQETLGLPQMSVALNLSAIQFQQENLVNTIQKVLAQTQLAPHCLELEITESIAMQNVAFTKETLAELDNMGVKISIDDFGTGYCSWSYLKEFPIHTLKIDRSFVCDLTTNSKDSAITTAIIALAHGLNLDVVAEGVETKEQRNLLRILECELMQGNLLSPAVPAEVATEILREFQSRIDTTSILAA